MAEATPETKTLETLTSEAPAAAKEAGASTQLSQAEAPDAWERPQRVLVLLAHPDDPEFFCGATLARWAAAGHEIIYWLLTCGDKGTSNRSLTSESLCAMRQTEQRAAAAVLGVREVNFLGYPDGYLIPDLSLRRDITRLIRQVRPNVMVTCDPKTLYIGGDRLNHPDHRAAGQAALDAVYPAARDHLNFYELWSEEQLEPHKVREVWIAGSLEPNVRLDVTEYWDTKLRAILEHKSQIGDPQAMEQRMRQRIAPDSDPQAPRYEEAFRKLVLE